DVRRARMVVLLSPPFTALPPARGLAQATVGKPALSGVAATRVDDMNSDDEQWLRGRAHCQDPKAPTLAHGQAALTTGTRRSVWRDQADPGR
ncbi:hypothetical protein, partial [Streptomyces europaeiscabiei]